MVFTIIHFKFLNKFSGFFAYRYVKIVVVFKLRVLALCLNSVWKLKKILEVLRKREMLRKKKEERERESL